MKTKTILFIVCAFAILMLCGCSTTQADTQKKVGNADLQALDATNQVDGSEQNSVENSPVTMVPKIALTKHSLVDDCWVVYDGYVYDVTEYLTKRAADDKSVVKYCGSTDDFERALRTSTGATDLSLFDALAIQKGKFSN